ncbi:MAG: hypothetical protein K6C69_04090 [Lachnospiraceae bacterium]|nr:hypothetical protein [Lachnospiraceae bacterium]
MIIPSLNKVYDLQVNQKQRIATTLRVLEESFPELAKFHHTTWIQIKSTGRYVSVEKTYEQAGIYTGAELLFDHNPRKVAGE